MSSQQTQQRRAPPLAGRPPFATDEPDDIYDEPVAAPRRRVQQEKPPVENRDTTYQAWDDYLHNGDNRGSAAGGIEMGLMAGDMDDSDDERPVPKKGQQQQPAARGQQQPPNNNKNFGKPPAMSNVPSSQPLTRPAPAAMATPTRQASYEQQQNIAQPRPRQAGVQRPAAAGLQVNVSSPTQPAMPIPRAPIPAFMAPSPSPSPSLNPHPLHAPSTPITPVFARPSFQESERKVEFANKDGLIMRGNSEETLIPRNTRKGDDFWRRFSVVAKDSEKTRYQKSSWLKRYEGGNSRMSRWVWCISIFLLLCIGGGIGFGWWATHNKPASLPVPIGGSENQAATEITPSAHTSSGHNTSRTLSAPLAVETKRSLVERIAEPAPEPLIPSSPKFPAVGVAGVKRHRSRMLLEALD